MNPTPLAFDPKVHQLIQAKARRLGNTLRLRAVDIQDLAQELWVRLLPRLTKHPPLPGKEQEWVRMLLWQIAANLRRDTLALKRDDRRTVSASSCIVTKQNRSLRLEVAISQEEERKHRGVEFRSEIELMEQVIDVNKLLKSLPQEVQEIAERLKSQIPTEIARELGIPRTRVYTAIQTLRIHLAALREKS